MKSTSLLKTKKNRKEISSDNYNLIDLLYSSPAKIYAWFRANSVDVDYETCEKLVLDYKV